MKLSDYVASFLAEHGIRHVFAITGGASIHLIHSIAERPDIDFICPAHEQGGAMAADGYARASGNLGCAIATSGPGATNLITGIAGAWFDSIPTLFITGQVVSGRFKGNTGVRQMGFQETEIVKMVSPITKYAVLITDPQQIKVELQRAAHLAKDGRPGPVLVDIPDDLQRADIDPDKLPSFSAPTIAFPRTKGFNVPEIARLVAKAKRPVLILGAGIHAAKAENATRVLVEQLGFPVCPTWGAMDILPSHHPLVIGGFGMDGTRHGNFTVQNADLILSIGARMSTRETGNNLKTWAREAKTIIVDIDEAELNKFAHFGRPITLPVVCDAKSFVDMLLISYLPTQDISEWVTRTQRWKVQYAVCRPEYRKETNINPYVFVDELSEECQDGETIVVDTGCAVSWMMQGFRFKNRQRLFHDWNNTAMGWGLPAAIGASLAANKKRIVCVSGDGSLLMNIQELCTAKRHDLPIKLFLINNNGYAMVQQTQEQWLNGKYHATTVDGGLYFPNFREVAKACGWTAISCHRNDTLKGVINLAMSINGPVFCDLVISRTHRVIPKCKFGYPIEDAEPLLPRAEFLSNMLVEPLPISR